MARVTASVYASHVPAIGVAQDQGKTHEPYWQPLFSGFELLKELRQLAVTRRAANQIHPGRPVKNLFTLLLGNTTEDANLFSFARDIPEFAKPGKNFLRRLLPDVRAPPSSR